MKNIKSYSIVYGSNPFEVSEEVNRLIQEGWKPYESLVVIQGNYGYMQAMVQLEEEG